MAELAIVIPSWNSRERIGDCIDSLLNQGEAVDVIVVDNGSSDGSAAHVRNRYPQVTLLAQQTNLGFAGGVNVGIRHALASGYAFVGLLNDDATAAPSWSKTLASVLRVRPEVGIATGLLLDGDGRRIDSTGDWYSVWGLPFPRDRDATATAAPGAGPVFGASGGASLYRAAMLRDIGLFDEQFFAYYEDVDISFRARLAGYDVWFDPGAKALHARGASSATMGLGEDRADLRADRSSPFTVHQTFKNLPLLLMKNVPSHLLAQVGWRFFCAYFLMLGKAVVSGRGRAATSGLVNAVGLSAHAIRERRRIQSAAVRSADDIAALLWHDLPPEQTGLRRLRHRVEMIRRVARRSNGA